MADCEREYRETQPYRECRERPEEHSVPTGVVMNCGYGAYVDFSNISGNGVFAASVDVDTTLLKNPRILIDFDAYLGYQLQNQEELDLVFTLVRTNQNGQVTELNSWPYTLLMDQTLATEDEQYVDMILEKNESIHFRFCDMPRYSGYYTYTMRIDENYYNITNAVVQASIITAMANSTVMKLCETDEGASQRERRWL